MITTKNINVDLGKGQSKLRQVTTKDIDASIKVPLPKKSVKVQSISTTTLQDVADIAEKKRRDDIMVQRKLAMKDEKKIVIVGKEIIEPKEIVFEVGDAIYKDEKGELIVKKKPEKTIEEFAREAGAKLVSTNIPIEHKIDKKKPWNKMNAKERKEYQAEKVNEEKVKK